MSTYSAVNGGLSEGPVGGQPINVEYDQATGTVTVDPPQVEKGTLVRFVDPTGGKLKIAFLSPMGDEIKTVDDTEVCAIMIGGCYHFRCYFTFPGAKHTIVPLHGGVIEVVPQRP